MPSTAQRRPLPALASLSVLLVFTGVVWWRVLSRGEASPEPAASATCPSAVVALRLPAPASVHLKVLNATDRAGIAAAARAALAEAGFDIPDAAGNDSKKYYKKITSVGEIRYGAQTRQAARLVHYYLPGAALRDTGTTSKTVTVSLGSKYRAVTSPAAVLAALAKDNAVAGTPAPAPSTC